MGGGHAQEGLPVTEVCDTPEKLPVVRSDERFRGHVIALRTDQVKMPDGTTAARDVVVHPGAVGVIALDDEERMLLVRQYRHPVGRLLWEPPAGILDVTGEPPLVTAQRELYEEAHYRAERWDVLVDAFTSPGMTDEALRIYLARGLSPADGERHQGVHEEYDMPIAWLALDEAVRRVLGGELHNPTAVMGILAAAVACHHGFAGLRPADAPWPERP
jgi:ADP-ribose pyrophosphatase